MSPFAILLLLFAVSAQGADCGVLAGRYQRAVSGADAATAAYSACIRRRDRSDCAAEFGQLRDAQAALERVVANLRLYCLGDQRPR